MQTPTQDALAEGVEGFGGENVGDGADDKAGVDFENQVLIFVNLYKKGDNEVDQTQYVFLVIEAMYNAVKGKTNIFSPHDNFLKEKESNQMVAKEIETDDEDEDSEDYEVYSEMD